MPGGNPSEAPGCSTAHPYYRPDKLCGKEIARLCVGERPFGGELRENRTEKRGDDHRQYKTSMEDGGGSKAVSIPVRNLGRCLHLFHSKPDVLSAR